MLFRRVPYRPAVWRDVSSLGLMVSRTLPLLALSLFSASSFAVPSLCTKEEVTEWSCAARGKVYSLCASADRSPATNYMQYRVGKNNKLEFSFPELREQPKGHFLLRLAPRGASLSFTNKGYEYLVYEPLAGPTTIHVSKDQTPVGSVTCGSATDTLTLTETQNRFRLLGIYE